MEQLESLLKRDRNRPSVIFWSTNNEEPSRITKQGRNLHKAIAAHIRKFDQSRPITAAVSNTPDVCQIYDDCEIIGINYNLSIYDAVHEQRPDKPAKILGTGSDHCDHNNVTLPQRKMYMSKIRIAVKPAKGQTSLTLTAISDHCGCTSIQVELPEA